MRRTSISIDEELHKQILAACEVTRTSQSAFFAMAAGAMLGAMRAISPPSAWVPPAPVEPTADDPLMRGVKSTDDAVIVELIRVANRLVLIRDGEIVPSAANEKQEILAQVYALRRAQLS